jgi:KUP system potassium uptake protein
MTEEKGSRSYLLALVVGAIGVVYGDIGTSPLYALRECFHGTHPMPATRDNILGVLSLILWALMFMVSFKYLGFIMRANNKGEGGILSLLALATSRSDTARRGSALLVICAVFGAALLYGDGMITPAITVLSGVEGLEVATPVFKPFIIPITVAILIGLFSFQHFGTGRVGSIFGPVMCLWFLTIAILGIYGIARAPEVLVAINPWYAVKFLINTSREGFIVLGAVFLAVTGAEALYADMGHFGIRPIRRAWFAVVFPALLLNYFGQGALLLLDPGAVENPFYFLAPRWAVYPLVIIATFAAVIASQALIAGAYSITMQAIQLGYVPRMEIRHTSSLERGQIYLPQINLMLMVACVGLVLGFRNSSNMAAAYGVAVTLTMITTSILFCYAARRVWHWPRWKVGLLLVVFLVPETVFFAANALKITHGGWFPLVVAIIIFTFMTTWKTGRGLIRQRLQAGYLPFDLFLQDLKNNPPLRVDGTAVFLAGNPNGTPVALLHNLKHNKILHKRVVVLTMVTDEVPHVDPTKRLDVQQLADGLHRVIGHFGFMEEPNVPKLLELCGEYGIEYLPMETTFFLSRETIIPSPKHGMAIWREKLFAIMSRNAQSATTFFGLPANRVVELGIQVEM